MRAGLVGFFKYLRGIQAEEGTDLTSVALEGGTKTKR